MARKRARVRQSQATSSLLMTDALIVGNGPTKTAQEVIANPAMTHDKREPAISKCCAGEVGGAYIGPYDGKVYYVTSCARCGKEISRRLRMSAKAEVERDMGVEKPDPQQDLKPLKTVIRDYKSAAAGDDGNGEERPL